MNSLVMSIKPQYADAIYSGVKQFEFRKKPPTNLKAVYLIYESAPVSKLTGTVMFCGSFTVRAGVMVEFICRLMKVKKTFAIEMMGISEKELISYAGGPNNLVTALMIANAERDSFYEIFRIRPPQNWGTIRAANPPFAETTAKGCLE